MFRYAKIDCASYRDGHNFIPDNDAVLVHRLTMICLQYDIVI